MLSLKNIYMYKFQNMKNNDTNWYTIYSVNWQPKNKKKGEK